MNEALLYSSEEIKETSMVKITNITRGYKTHADRKRALAQLFRRGFNYFVFYRDTQAQFALQFGNADWVKEGTYYLNA